MGSADTVTLARSVELAIGDLTAQALRRLEAIPWYAGLPADVRSWVGVVVSTGLSGFVRWLRDPEAGPAAPDATFAAAPQAAARAVSLEQTVELIRVTIDAVESAVADLAPPARVDELRRQVERYGREVAFAAAAVYARVAEQRGALDARLQALVVEALLAGEAERVVASRAGALGWPGAGPVCAFAAGAADGDLQTALDQLQRAAHRDGLPLAAAIHGSAVVAVVPVGEGRDPSAIVAALGDGLGHTVVGSVVAELAKAGPSARAALSGLGALGGWPGAPRPVAADDLLPERVLAGDGEARVRLLERCYNPLEAVGRDLVVTVEALLGAGGSLEATARALFVHPNTVRYRLSRVLDLTGYDPRAPRDAFALRLALVLARL